MQCAEVGILPRLERVLERSIIACLLGLFRIDRLARAMSAVTRVMVILLEEKKREISHHIDLIPYKINL